MSLPLLAQAALITSATVGLEALATSKSQAFGWVIGNTAFGVIGLFGIPLLVYAGGEKLSAGSLTRQRAPAPSPIVSSPTVVVHHTATPGQGGVVGGVGGDEKAEVLEPATVSHTLAVAQAKAIGGRFSEATGLQARRRRMTLDLSSSSSTPLIVAGINFVVCLAIVWLGYLTSDELQSSFYWRLLYLLLPLQIVMIACDKKKQRYSFPCVHHGACQSVLATGSRSHSPMQVRGVLRGSYHADAGLPRAVVVANIRHDRYGWSGRVVPWAVLCDTSAV